MSVEPQKPRQACCSKLKLFLVSLAFAYFAKAFGGSYMKSSITQIERRFDIPSSLTGVIDGGFEMGNLLVIAFVSYFGAKLHRPRLIGIGCLLMATGSFLTALPHFFQGRYKYETSMSHNSQVNSTANTLPCLSNQSLAEQDKAPDLEQMRDCEKAAGSSMWIYVFLGNMLRGIGETPVMPLGISYMDDFSKEENTPFYLACIHTVGILGPMVGFMMGSFLAKIYVDIGFTDLETITITHRDSRWVGAWWLGFIVSGTVMLLASIPFFFLSKTLPKEGEEENKSTELTALAEQENFLPEEAIGAEEKEKPVTFKEMVKDFVPSLRRLFKNSIFSLMILTNLVAVNGFIGMITFKPKFMEQTYGQSASRAIFLIGMKQNCSCSADEWDPVCADSGITYISPCMAGCLNSSGYGKNTVFHNCSCVSTSFPAGTSSSVKLGQCPHAKDCSRSFTSYMAVSVLSSFISSLGATPGYMVIIRCISPELKSLALGIQALVTRTLGGIPAPVYFGALIDSTCLKWSVKKCGGQGACRLYESDMYRVIFLGLITCLSGSSYFFMIAVIVLLRRQFRGQDGEKETQRIKASKDIELQIPSNATEGAGASMSPKVPHDLKVTTDCDKEEAVDRLGQPSRDNESKCCTQTTTEFTLHVTDEASKDLACWEAESQQEINHTEERSQE
uniref:Solute carrier organic anion transporter family member n=1 Tax=Oryzias latipes TaxID=8090 RepID=H2LXW0_ORYLA